MKLTDSTLSPLPQTASSGRMAELMGGEAGGFIGFEAVSGRVGGWEGVAVEEVPCGVGAEFQVVLKQLGKRDTTTKLKVCVLLCRWPWFSDCVRKCL